MKKIIISVCLILILAVFFLQMTAEKKMDTSELEAEAINIVKTFGGTLKPKLKAAIQTGGLEHAVNICAEEAPRIAKNLMEETGWDIKRVSLKPRNKNSAVPDTFERKVLEQFNERQMKGESPSKIKYSEIVGTDFRFMKAQGVEGVCLNCHGDSISPAVKKEIAKHYPDDVATGYSLGQVRGAFSLIKTL